MIKTIRTSILDLIHSNLKLIETNPLSNPKSSDDRYDTVFDLVAEIGTRNQTFAIGDTEQSIYHIVDKNYMVHLFYLKYNRTGAKFVDYLCSAQLEITPDMKR